MRSPRRMHGPLTDPGTDVYGPHVHVNPVYLDTHDHMQAMGLNILASIDLDERNAGARSSASYGRGNAVGKRKEIARVYPRRKAGEMVRSTNKAIELTIDDLVPYFGNPLKKAAYHMGLCPTALKSVCRKLGVHRWPYQQSRRLAPDGFVGDDANMEPEGEGEMSSSSSASGASTVAGEQQFASNSPSEHSNGANRSESVHSQSPDSTLEAGMENGTAMDEIEQCKLARAQSLAQSNGDGPASLGTTKRGRGKSREKVTDRPSVYSGASGYLRQCRGRDMGEHFNPHVNYAYPASYAYYPHYLSIQHFPMAGVPYTQKQQILRPQASSTSRVAAASTNVHAKHRADTSSSKPSPHSVDCSDSACTTSEDDLCTRPLELAETSETPEVELSRAARRLQIREWSSLAQRMAGHQSQWQTPRGDGSTLFDCWDWDEADGTCDMAYLSPCS